LVGWLFASLLLCFFASLLLCFLSFNCNDID
jgi:hypothetical protein